MKRIININLSGRVIPIEDSAYDRLKSYIESLRRYFAAEEGCDEIINDIESRMAELMNEKIKKGAASITDADVDEMIGIMGRIEDFEEVDGEPQGSSTAAGGSSYQQSSRSRFTGRLYRDDRDKIIGGVCAGIANYSNIDPAIVRLVFAVITLGGFGFGFLLYILAWIILPARPLNTYTGKRLFRNPDDRIIGGVAGGLGAYFNKPAWAIRLIMAAPLLLNILFSTFHNYFPNLFIGSFTGTFILIYIILWIVLPEALTPYDKMEMRGEKVDINTIRQNVQEGMGSFKDRMQSWGEEVKTVGQNMSNRAREFTRTQGADFAADVRQTARPIGTGLAHALGVIIKAFFLLVFGCLAFALFIGIIVLLFGGGSAVWSTKENLLGFALNGFWQYVFFWGTVIFFFLVPVIAFITWLVRRFMKVRSQRHYLGYVFGGLWFLGMLCAGLLTSALVRDAARRGEVVEPLTAGTAAASRLLVRMDEPPVRYSGDLLFVDEGEGFDLVGDTMKLTDITLRVTPAYDSSHYGVMVHKFSRGRSRIAAEERAADIVYRAVYRDSMLLLGSGFAITRSNKYRGQRILVEIMVPVGKKIRFDPSIADRLNNVHVRFSDRPYERHWRIDSDWDDDGSFAYKTGVDYIMLPNGRLQEAGLTDPTLPLAPADSSETLQPKESMRRTPEQVTMAGPQTEKPAKAHPPTSEVGGDIPTPMPIPFVPTIF